MRLITAVIQMLMSSGALAGSQFETFELDQVPLRSAFEAWAVRAEVVMVVDWAKLEDAGVEVDRPVSMAFTHVRTAIVDSVGG